MILNNQFSWSEN